MAAEAPRAADTQGWLRRAAADLRGARGVGTDYRFADLSSADLRDLDLSRALLKGAFGGAALMVS